MTTFNPPVTYPNYPAYLWTYVTDKTGTVYQTLGGNIGSGTGWGTRVWRCPPGKPPQLIYFIDGGNGALTVDHMNKRLLFLGTVNGQPYCVVIAGYIYPDDIPSPQIVNINESQLASLRQSLATSTDIAEQAKANAKDAAAVAYDTRDSYKALQTQVNELQKRIDSLQQQVSGLLTPSQVADLVWQKIKDINYLYRIGFVSWPTPAPDSDIRAYIGDLVALIKKAK